MNNEEWRINIVKDGRGDSSVFFVITRRFYFLTFHF